MLVFLIRLEGLVEIVDGGSSDRIERRRHRRREDCGYYQTRQSAWHVFRDEVGKHAVAACEWKRCRSRRCVSGIAERLIERKQQHADEQKPDELGQHDTAAGQQRHDRAFWTVGAEVSLHEILIGPVRAHRQEATANQSRPECISLRMVEREVENRILAKLRRERTGGAETAV